MRRVGVLVFEHTRLFEFAVVREIWGVDRTGCGIPAFDFIVAGSPSWPAHGAQRSEDADALAGCDLVVVPGVDDPDAPVPERVLEAVRRAHAAGATLAALCSGTFVLAAAGVLDGRRATVHWLDGDRLAARFPRVRADTNSLYVNDANVWTSAGTAASIDMCLALLRVAHGAYVAEQIASVMLVAPARAADLPQPTPSLAPPSALDRALGDAHVRQAVLDDLSRPWTVRDMAARAGYSERGFARRFTAATGMTPLQWLLGQRVFAAQSLLEATDLPVAVIASRCGFGTPVSMRTHFARQVGVTPSAYRRRHRERQVT